MNKTTLCLLLAVAGHITHRPTAYAPGKNTGAVKIETVPPGTRCYSGIAAKKDRVGTRSERIGTSLWLATIPGEDGNFPNTGSPFTRTKTVFDAEPPRICQTVFFDRRK